ncbi:hypothetical protein L6164_037060 [Bauhinia variegata]|uniref:Uncharacterized protein n=1 Tax=Bauhinia variegata TaxID=167791 RepID=A0ACB9KJ07_BAUVA|nr:hypothetical protein L6164_037060 [Bauhinia variegata]
MKMLVCWVVLCTIIWVLHQASNTYPTEEARAHAYSKIIEIFLIKSLMFIVFNSSCCYVFISAPNEYYDPQIRCIWSHLGAKDMVLLREFPQQWDWVFFCSYAAPHA